MSDKYIIQDIMGLCFVSYDDDEGVTKWSNLRGARWFNSLEDAKRVMEKICNGEIIQMTFYQVIL